MKTGKKSHHTNLVPRFGYKQPTRSSQAKLESRWLGPMTIIKRVSARCYDVKDSHGTTHNVHIEDLKPYINMEPQGPGTLLIFKRELSHHKKHVTKVGEIVEHRITKEGCWEFLVHWTCDNPAEDTWENPSVFADQGLLPYLLQYCNKHSLQITLHDLLPPPAANPDAVVSTSLDAIVSTISDTSVSTVPDAIVSTIAATLAAVAQSSQTTEPPAMEKYHVPVTPLSHHHGEIP